jgi:hypothetical protein
VPCAHSDPLRAACAARYLAARCRRPTCATLSVLPPPYHAFVLLQTCICNALADSVAAIRMRVCAPLAPVQRWRGRQRVQGGERVQEDGQDERYARAGPRPLESLTPPQHPSAPSLAPPSPTPMRARAMWLVWCRATVQSVTRHSRRRDIRLTPPPPRHTTRAFPETRARQNVQTCAPSGRGLPRGGQDGQDPEAARVPCQRGQERARRVAGCVGRGRCSRIIVVECAGR